MDPRAVLRPVGPRPATVYWVRRIAALVAVLVVLLLLAHACAGGSGGGQRPTAGGTSHPPTPTPTPSASTSPRPPQHTRLAACTRRQLHVTATTDSTTYAAGVQPQLRAVVRNSGAACRYDPAPSQRSWRIASGTDQIWTTDDCHRSAQASKARLAAGHTITYALTWDRHRSVKGCASPGAAAQAGTYRLYVTVMGAASAPAVFHLAG